MLNCRSDDHSDARHIYNCTHYNSTHHLASANLANSPNMTYTNGDANGQNGHAGSPIPAASRLRKMLKESDELIVMPGVYDGFSARIALEVGFDGLYMVSTPSSCSWAKL